MKDKETDQIWKALHKELPAVEQLGFQESLVADEVLSARYREAQAVHEGLQSAKVSEEAWLEGMTSRVLDEMEREENSGRLSFVQNRVAQWVAMAALLMLGFFSFNLWNSSPSLNWESPEIIVTQFRGDSLAASMFSDDAMQSWHKGFEAEVNGLFKKTRTDHGSGWSIATTFLGVDEGLRVEVKAQRAQSESPVRSWTFFASDLEALEASRKKWADVVVRGIVANDP